MLPVIVLRNPVPDQMWAAFSEVLNASPVGRTIDRNGVSLLQRHESLPGRIRIGRQRFDLAPTPSDPRNARSAFDVVRIADWFPPPQINPRILKARSPVLAC